MDVLRDQFHHAAWANHLVLEANAGVRDEAECSALVEPARHIAWPERRYLALLRGETGDALKPVAPEELRELIAYCDETAAGFQASWPTSPETEIFVPHWGRDFRIVEILATVLSHSAQHRAEIAWELARTGIDTRELDFIVWVGGGRPAPGGALTGLPDD